MIKRLPRFAEVKLKDLCAEYGALCHEAEEDERGWDCLIEFPEEPRVGPADTHPHAPSAKVQVKSTRGRSLSCRIKLSNALRAVQSREPGFIMLVYAPSGRKPTKIYAVHVWEALIRQTLEEVRRAESERRPLNRSRLTVTFGPADEKTEEDLIQWMHHTVRSIQPEYDEAKRAINQRVGFEDGCGTVTMSIEANAEDEILRGFLGLGDGLRVRKFEYTPKRFGITAPEPAISEPSGTIQIMPPTLGSAEIKLRSECHPNLIVLHGKVYTTSLPGLPEEKRMVRVSEDVVDIVLGPERKFEFRCTIHPDRSYRLESISNFCALDRWLTSGEVSLQIWFKGRRINHVMAGKRSPLDKERQEWHAAVRVLREIADASLYKDVAVTLRDIVSAHGLKTFSQVIGPGYFRVEFEPTPDAPNCFSSIVYWSKVKVGDFVFCVLVEREVVDDNSVHGKRIVTARNHKWIDSYVRPVSEIHHKLMQDDYERHLSHLKETRSPLGLGDLEEFISGSGNGEPSPILDEYATTNDNNKNHLEHLVAEWLQ